MDEISIRAEAEINPTESEEKVKQAIGNVFGSLPTRIVPLRKGRLAVVEATGQQALDQLRNLLRRERIRSAARRILLRGIDRRTISFCLNKQVAYAGHVSFSEEEAESPMGPIKVKIECENPREVIDWLVPRLV